ncbi:hypothetical protein AcV5_007895 [Taiwanofungus camphoratus]|nr:hypothetical protein AcV5_007895 [Antrodia cinnamomea]
MASMTWFFLMLCAPSLSYAYKMPYARASPPNPLWRRGNTPAAGFYNPSSNGGRWLTAVDDTFPPGQGEPLNAVISAYSDSMVLVDQETDGGLLNYFLSFGYSGECLGQHMGDAQAANLGDGNGYINQTAEIRWDFSNPELGTCEETIQGGAHFRYWIQNGKQADSGAVFMAVSYELPEADNHDIIFNGYNLGRDWFVGNVTNQTSIIPTANVTNASTYSGQTSFDGYTYHTTVVYDSGYLPNTSYGINHNLTVGNSVTEAVDGLVAVLTVKVVAKPASSCVLLSFFLSSRSHVSVITNCGVDL